MTNDCLNYITNDSIQSLCKVGCVNISNKTSHNRAIELFNTSVPEKFNIFNIFWI